MTEGVIKEAAGIAKVINDPVLISLILVIISLLVFLFYMAWQTDKKQERYFQIINNFAEEIHNNSQTLVKLTTLIEVLVHGRNTKS